MLGLGLLSLLFGKGAFLKRSGRILILAALLCITADGADAGVRKFWFLMGTASLGVGGWQGKEALDITGKIRNLRNNHGYVGNNAAQAQLHRLGSESAIEIHQANRRNKVLIAAGAGLFGLTSWIYSFTGPDKKSEEIEEETIIRKKRKTKWDIQAFPGGAQVNLRW